MKNLVKMINSETEKYGRGNETEGKLNTSERENNSAPSVNGTAHQKLSNNIRPYKRITHYFGSIPVWLRASHHHQSGYRTGFLTFKGY